jgi:hypothetical protein
MEKIKVNTRQSLEGGFYFPFPLIFMFLIRNFCKIHLKKKVFDRKFPYDN